MHESIFSYNVSRPYPYRWFTWTVFVGGTLALVIFSLINFQAAGFEYMTVYTANTTETEFPNKTFWYQHRPWSLAHKMRPTCLAQTIYSGSTLYTNNHGFPYILGQSYTNLSDQSTMATSIAYKNDPIRDCTIFQILAKSEDTSYTYAINVKVLLSCSVQAAGLPVSLDLSTEFQINTDVGYSLYGTNTYHPVALLMSDKLNETAPSLYWGKQLARAYISLFTNALQTFSDTYVGIASQLATEVEIDMSWYMMFEETSAYEPVPPVRADLIITTSNKSTDLGLYTSSDENPSLTVWSAASLQDEAYELTLLGEPELERNMPDSVRHVGLISDAIAKSIYWTILADLGQNITNILADPQQLMSYFTASVEWLTAQELLGLDPPNPTSNDSLYGDPFKWLIWDLPLGKYENTTKFYHDMGTSIPNVQPAVFAQEYTCQVPKLKTAAGLIVGILVADLVFLQALWKLFNFLTSLILTRREPRANYCAGCEEALSRRGEDLEMHDSVDNIEVVEHELDENSEQDQFDESSEQHRRDEDSEQDQPADESSSLTGRVHDVSSSLDRHVSKSGQDALVRLESNRTDR